MKKILAVLLALCVVGGAFAQVTTAIAGYGEIDLYDQAGQATFAPYGTGYDTFTFKATNADGNAGLSMTDGDWTTDSIFTIRDWSAWYKGQFTKVILGKLRNADFRGTLPNGLYANYFFGMDRISGQGLLIETTTLGALTLGVNLPAPIGGMDAIDMLKNSDVAAKFAIENVGKVYFLYDLDLVDNAKATAVEFAFSFTGVENLTASAIYKGAFGADTTHYFALGADYAMDKLGLAVEFDGDYGTAFEGEIALKVSYAITEKLSAYVQGMYDFAGTYDAKLVADYDYGTGINSEVVVGYNGALYYDIALCYGFSF